MLKEGLNIECLWRDIAKESVRGSKNSVVIDASLSIYIYEGRSKLLILLQLKNGRHRF